MFVGWGNWKASHLSCCRRECGLSARRRSARRRCIEIGLTFGRCGRVQSTLVLASAAVALPTPSTTASGSDGSQDEDPLHDLMHDLLHDLGPRISRAPEDTPETYQRKCAAYHRQFQASQPLDFPSLSAPSPDSGSCCDSD